jgi:transposase InsO family protein
VWTNVNLLTKRKINILRFDNEGDYTSKELVSFCKADGIRRELIFPYNPQQKGVAERKNRSIEEYVKEMMNDQNLSMFLWGEEVMESIYV